MSSHSWCRASQRTLWPALRPATWQAFGRPIESCTGKVTTRRHSQLLCGQKYFATNASHGHKDSSWQAHGATCGCGPSRMPITAHVKRLPSDHNALQQTLCPAMRTVVGSRSERQAGAASSRPVRGSRKEASPWTRGDSGVPERHCATPAAPASLLHQVISGRWRVALLEGRCPWVIPIAPR